MIYGGQGKQPWVSATPQTVRLQYYLHPLLKKPGLDLLFKNFRPISNLQFVSKFTEHVVANQIQCHMLKNNLFSQLQSAYRSHHSTETALPQCIDCIDTVDHKILLKPFR